MVIPDLMAWLEHATPEEFPYDAVVDAYLHVGKHFVGADLLTALAKARDAVNGESRPHTAATDLLMRFLDVALDKWDDRYDYPSYTALALLPLPSVDDSLDALPQALPRRDWLVTQLAADALRFELAVADGRCDLLGERRPDLRRVVKRYRLGTKVVAPALARLGLGGEVTAAAPEPAARQLWDTVERRATADERLVLRLSMLPVHVSHDEYLFIRVLQLFETTFAMLALHLRAAIERMGTGEVAAAAGGIEIAETVLRESAPMFSLLGTMQIEAFRTFRDFTEGASAIQSRNYKIVESLCRPPDPERLDSTAFRSVPEVRERVLAGPPTLDQAVAAARAAGHLDGPDGERLTGAMRAFAGTLRRWRQTHYGLALRMLGNRTGTGYTEGTPYLAAVRKIPVFRSVDPA